MNSQQAETAVTTSALILTGLYAYRKTSEGVTGSAPPPRKHSAKTTAEGVVGVGELLPLGTWLTGMGVTFIGLAIVASVSPSLGGTMAILVATGGFLGNGTAVLKDLQSGLKGANPGAGASTHNTTGSEPPETGSFGTQGKQSLNHPAMHPAIN